MAIADTSVQIYAPGPSQEGRGFKQGHAKVGGRQKGSRNRFGGDLREAVVAGIQAVGFMGKDKDGKPERGPGGVQGFIEWLAMYEPKTAAALFARVLPYFINVGMEVPEVVSETEMEAMLKELGLPAGLIEHRFSRRSRASQTRIVSALRDWLRRSLAITFPNSSSSVPSLVL
jgi:hypothetical protein